MITQVCYRGRSVVQALFALSAFLLVGSGCTSDSSAPNNPPIERQAKVDSAQVGVESEYIHERLDSLGSTVYFSFLVDVFVFITAAGLTWILVRRERKNTEQLRKQMRRRFSELEKNTLTKDDPRRKASGESSSKMRELQNQLIQMRERLREIEGEGQTDEDRLQESGGATTGIPESSDGTQGSAPKSGFQEDPSLSGREDQQSRSHTEQKQIPEGKGRIEKDYNRVKSGNFRREKFKEKYDPLRLGIENEEQRLNSEDAPVVLHPDNRGKYLAVKEGEGYHVLPKFQFVVEDTDRREVGIDEVFSCGDVPYNYPYEVQHIEKAARFKRDPSSSFMLEEAGEIDLKRYD